jgi:glutathione S-transferase
MASTITLHQFTPLYGLPNGSPFCIKLETYLRMAGLKYEVATIRGPIKSHTGKAPYISCDGETLHDSGLIIAHLEQKHGHPVDGKLTLSERATSLAFQRMMEEHLYWATVYARWTDPARPAETLQYAKEVIGLTGFLGVLVPRIVQRTVKKALWNHGLGRHHPADIWKLGIDNVQALGHWLGNRAYGFGEQPTVFDAVLFSAIASIVRTPWDFPLKTETLKHRNLLDHTDRMLSRYFPELSAPSVNAAAS